VCAAKAFTSNCIDRDTKLRIEGAAVCLNSILEIFAPNLIEKAAIEARVNMALEPIVYNGE
jgi:hypothetical protein